MKSITFTDFRNNASGLITEVEHGETLILIRRGKPVAEIIPYSDQIREKPSWKKPGIHLQLQGENLSTALAEEREEYR